MNRYLRLSSITIISLLASCSTPYKGLKVASTAQPSAFEYKPEFNRELYRCIVDGRFIFKKFHLSGVLFFKQLENGTKRAIFQNEMGIAFFDFEWNKDNQFKVRQIMQQLDKEAVVKTLQKDLEMLMMIGLDKKSEKILQGDRGNEYLHRLNRNEAYVYYITNSERLVKIENSNNRKRIVTVEVGDKKTKTSMPQTITYKHHKANFTISLTKIESDVNE